LLSLLHQLGLDLFASAFHGDTSTASECPYCATFPNN
jgi:hypothetical protein